MFTLIAFLAFFGLSVSRITLKIVDEFFKNFLEGWQGAPWSWKVMEFRKTIFQAWKVMENSKGHGKVMENDDNVMEFFLLH